MFFFCVSNCYVCCWWQLTWQVHTCDLWGPSVSFENRRASERVIVTYRGAYVTPPVHRDHPLFTLSLSDCIKDSVQHEEECSSGGNKAHRNHTSHMGTRGQDWGTPVGRNALHFLSETQSLFNRQCIWHETAVCQPWWLLSYLCCKHHGAFCIHGTGLSGVSSQPLHTQNTWKAGNFWGLDAWPHLTWFYWQKKNKKRPMKGIWHGLSHTQIGEIGQSVKMCSI